MLAVFTKDAEVKIMECLNQVEAHKVSYRALHFHFMSLLDQYKNDYQKKITMNIINDHMRDADGSLFMFNDGDVILICSGISKNNLEKLIFQLRYLYSDDPLAYQVDGRENADFCAIYDLGAAYDDFFAQARKKTISIKKEQEKPAEVADKKELKPLTPLRLANLEKDLLITDLSPFLRRQPICAINADKSIKKLINEIYVNIAHLQRSMYTDVNLYSNRSLFRYLTQLLDMKMLDMLGKRPALYFEMPSSLNLNVETILSKAFLEFDAMIKPVIKVSVVIELQASDVIDNINDMGRVRDILAHGGYKVCLDGLSYLNFIQLDRERLGFDLAKLRWDADMDAESHPADYWKLRESILKYGPNRVILCRCDAEKAVNFAHSLGLSLLQGRYLDYLLNPTSKTIN